MKQCPSCQATVSDTAKFCMECGFNIKKHEEEQAQPKAQFCPECGTEIPKGSFCPECGYKIGDVTVATATPTQEDPFGDGWLSDLESTTDADVAERKEQQARLVAENALAAFDYVEHADGTYTITGLKDRTALQYTIPAGVVAIAERAFEGCNAFKVTLANSVLQIGDGAFKSCKNLSEINLPASLIVIGDEAFAECESLDIRLSESIRKVGTNAIRNTVQDKKQKQEAEERRKAEEARRAEEARLAEEKRIAEEARRAEEERLAEEKRQEAAKQERKKALDDRAQKNAAFLQKAKEDFLEKAKAHAKSAFRREGDTVYFGMYPQSFKNKNVAVYDQKDKNGWHMGSDGQLYHLEKETGNYYQVEPIRWKVLYENDTELKLVSEKIVDFFNCRALDNKLDCSGYVKTIMASVTNDTILKTAYLEAESCFDLISVQDVELLSKAERKKETTDFAQRMGFKRGWAMVGPRHDNGTYYTGNIYTFNLFGNAVPFTGCSTLGIVPCIKVKKKTLDISDVDNMAETNNLYISGAATQIKEIFVVPGDVVKEGDPLYKYDCLQLKCWGAWTDRRESNVLFTADFSGVITQVFFNEGDEFRPRQEPTIAYFPTEDR